MTGPVLWVVLRVEDPLMVVDVSRKIASATANRGYGAVFTSVLIGCWDAEERRNLEAIEKEFDANLSVSVTDHPLQTSAFEIFRPKGSERDRMNFMESGLPGLILEIARLDGITTLVFIVSRDPWMSEKLPRLRVSLKQFLEHLSEYNAKEADPSLEFGGDGVFILQLPGRDA